MNKMLLLDAKRAADKLYENTSVSRETTLDQLEELAEHVAELIGTVDDIEADDDAEDDA